MQLAELPWTVVESLDRDLPVVIPVAALEQHGHHLPLFTDSMLLGEVVRRAAERCRDTALFAPLTWLGNSHHHLDFPGTLSAEPRLYLDLLRGLANQFLTMGFRRIVFLNGHGGNIVPGRQATFELRQEHRQRKDLLLLFATYWETAEPPADGAFHQHEMGHACEWETSMILRIAPHLVGDYEAAVDVASDGEFGSTPRAWTTKDRTAPGHIGAPRHATPEKGELLLSTFSAGVESLVENVRKWSGARW
ncbi:Creatinine amidohydrolase [Caulifigura coniformis]|uniref:Creatinine amidohydrolase n=1 Tax=Caulifigura coniformis TaxID=2527983 RepID=A0A517SFR0_9PLAN|nr:creatininase family protein [Caulifigura coniformis]QDT54964.1 Creatinine amidohydrolase [Caulifigura coniformis]